MRASAGCRPRESGDVKVSISDAYNVVRLLVRLGSTFDEIAALGFHSGGRKLTGAALEVWYLAEKEQRKPLTDAVLTDHTRKRSKV
jgi:hypothetical protein